MAKDKSKPSKETAPCPHVSLKRQNVGNQRWYKCLVCPQKFTATEWDGKVAVECTAPAPQPAELREALREALDLIWKHHEIGFIRRAYEQRGGSCELCGDSRLLAIGKVLESADAAAATPQVTPTPEPFPSERKVLTDEIQKATGVSPQVFGKQASPTPDKECPRCGSNSQQVYFGGCCGFCPDHWHSSRHCERNQMPRT